MIRSFKCKESEKILNKERIKGWPSWFQRIVRRKLIFIDEASDINDLRVPPGNRLEKLKGLRKDQYSIRINDQWRICFNWKDGDAHNLEIIDYH